MALAVACVQEFEHLMLCKSQILSKALTCIVSKPACMTKNARSLDRLCYT